jgi:uncharacterized protein (DUF1778 family)
MSQARTRLVNFRVTDEEFERLKTASGRLGARCLSDFARTVMLNHSAILPASSSQEDRLMSFDHRINVLEHSMERLVEALSGPKARSTNSEN